MRQLRIELETVTPLFLGGAEGKGGDPELRPPAFRGAMRYWLRAALGGVIGDGNLKGLKQAEAAVFGSTDCASPIGLRIPFKALASAKVPILPHKGQGKVPAFKAGQRFELVMTQMRDQRAEIWQAACASLEMAITFGGVGLRSRRGFGTLRITKSDSSELSLMPEERAEWKDHINLVTSRAIQAAQGLVGLEQANKLQVKGLPKGPANFPCATQMGVIRLGAAQYRSARDAIIAFMSRVPQKDFVGGIHPRQASPLWLRPVKMGHKYGLLFVVLASDFKGQDYNALNQLLKRFKGENIRVKGWTYE